MSTPDEVETRLTALEDDVDRLREEGAQTRALAGLVDRDTSDLRTILRGQTRLLGALRETQVEQGRVLEHVVSTLTRLVDGR